MAKPMLDLAARLAFRGAGHVEPNPLVGCVLVAAGEVIGLGHHRVFGGPHAEADAMADAVRRGHGAKLAGATAYVTLEPCNARGKQPPCVDALLAARIARVVLARLDPNPLKAGGAERLRAGGVEVEVTDVSPDAAALAEPFVHRVRTGLPWVMAKWAQTIDGKVATRAGASQWISGERSRRAVHLLRGRVDAVLTGIGTVLADDPLLTARGVPVRRVARRVVIDPEARTPLTAKLITSASGPGAAPTTVIVAAGHESRLASAAAAAGVEVVGMPAVNGGILLRGVLTWLARERGVSTMLVEAGGGLLGSLLAEDLINEARVYVGPTLLGDAAAMSPVRGLERPGLDSATPMTLRSLRRVGADAELVYRRLGTA